MNNQRNFPNLVQADHSQYAAPLPFAPGYSAAVCCRLSHFHRDDVGNIHCQIHNARGIVGARISRPVSHNVGLEEWGIYEVTVVITIGQKDQQAEILKLKKIPEYAHPNLAPLIPYLLCDMPKKLEELCHLIQLVQCRHLQTVLSSAFWRAVGLRAADAPGRRCENILLSRRITIEDRRRRHRGGQDGLCHSG